MGNFFRGLDKILWACYNRTSKITRFHKDFKGFWRILNDSEGFIVIIREYKGKKREYKVKTIKKPRIISSTNCSFKTLKVN